MTGAAITRQSRVNLPYRSNLKGCPRPPPGAPLRVFYPGLLTRPHHPARTPGHRWTGSAPPSRSRSPLSTTVFRPTPGATTAPAGREPQPHGVRSASCRRSSWAAAASAYAGTERERGRVVGGGSRAPASPAGLPAPAAGGPAPDPRLRPLPHPLLTAAVPGSACLSAHRVLLWPSAPGAGPTPGSDPRPRRAPRAGPPATADACAPAHRPRRTAGRRAPATSPAAVIRTISGRTSGHTTCSARNASAKGCTRQSASPQAASRAHRFTSRITRRGTRTGTQRGTDACVQRRVDMPSQGGQPSGIAAAGSCRGGALMVFRTLRTTEVAAVLGSVRVGGWPSWPRCEASMPKKAVKR
ncbi:hypothetical protein EDD92_5873 [Streptomyces sp. TLI_185]|nr:hypothetical protein EDD92_5873 [Streptomyces sp. TLI_185]